MQQIPLQTVATGDGHAQVIFPTLATGTRRIVRQVVVSNASAFGNTAQQVSVVMDGQIICSTTNATDTAAGDPPVTVTAKNTLTVQWTGLDAGVQATAVFYYDDQET